MNGPVFDWGFLEMFFVLKLIQTISRSHLSSFYWDFILYNNTFLKRYNFIYTQKRLASFTMRFKGSDQLDIVFDMRVQYYREVYQHSLNNNKTFFNLEEIKRSILHSYSVIIHRQNALSVQNNSYYFSLQYCTLSLTTMSSRSLPSKMKISPIYNTFCLQGNYPDSVIIDGCFVQQNLERDNIENQVENQKPRQKTRKPGRKLENQKTRQKTRKLENQVENQ